MRASLLAMLVPMVLVACGDGTGDGGSKGVHSVTVTPSTGQVVSGGQLQLTATVDADAGVSDRTATWSSSDVAKAAVDPNGLVTAGLITGNATIKATSKADPVVQGSALVVVSPAGEVASVTITPLTKDIAVGGSYVAVATVEAAAGVVRTVKWKSSDTTVATVDSAATRGIKAGSATLTATADANPAIKGVATVTVH